MREFYCIRCFTLHKAGSDYHSLRILSTGYHVINGQRYQICICEAGKENSATITEAASGCSTDDKTTDGEH